MASEPHPKPEAAGAAAENEAVDKAVGAWVQQFARTLKNCRLYDARNPTVVRFREQLATGLQQVLVERGAFTLRFSADDVTCDGASLYPARSRDDNLALPFYRDGIRAITFRQSLAPAELDGLIAAILQATAPGASEDDDLVTLLWQAQLSHVDVDYVPAEGEVAATPGAQEVELVPWPAAVAPEDPADPAARTVVDPPPGEDPEPRSDDWSVGEPTSDLEAGFAELAQTAAGESARFAAEFEAERAVSPVRTTVRLARAFLAAEAGPGDAPELGRYLPRVLRAAVHEGLWREAHEALKIIREAQSDWSPVTFAQELQQTVSMEAITQRLEQQGDDEVEAFAGFAEELGDLATDVLAHVAAEMAGSQRVRPITAALLALCKNNPERLVPWLSDRRPAVVKSAVQMLGAIGGNGIVGPLQAVLNHPDARVRAEVLAALRGIDAHAAKPLLLPLLDTTDTRQFCAAVQKLSEARDSQVAESLLMLLIQPEFEQRPAEEKHAIYLGLGATGGDEVIPELEAELLKGGWFGRGNETHRQAIARCIQRIGTPMARMVIEHGAQSRKTPVRDVCREILSRWEQAHG